jgi:DNA-binding XRE family transcriptional regulator
MTEVRLYVGTSQLHLILTVLLILTSPSFSTAIKYRSFFQTRALTVSVSKRSFICLEPGVVDSPAWSTCRQQCAYVARACTIFLYLDKSVAYGAAS